jgi:hypothetical protein
MNSSSDAEDSSADSTRCHDTPAQHAAAGRTTPLTVTHPRPVGALGAAAHVAVVEAEEVEALASFAQVHDPRLRLFRLKPKLGEQRPE